MSSVGNIIKMLVGIVILIIGVVWYSGPRIDVAGFTLFNYLDELIIVLKASVGLFLLFIGLIVAWMGYDDYKMDQEMAKEEKKEEK